MKRPIIATAALLATLALTACEPASTSQQTQAGSVRALFADRPDDLFRAVELTCRRPTDSFRKVSDSRIQCRSKLPPRATAGAILTFGGTVKDLPELVLQLDSRRRANGHLVESSYFLVVPREGKPDLVVKQDNARANKRLRDLFIAAGGRPAQ